MDLNEQKEKFSKAWVRAVAAVAGYAVFESDTDDDSIDLTIAVRGGGGTIRSPKLDVQIKCSGVVEASGDGWRVPLKLKNYDDLRDTNVDVPRVLVFVSIPTDPNWWFIQNSGSALLRHSAYWAACAAWTRHPTLVPGHHPTRTAVHAR
jgi:hypothetical protein